MPEHACTSACDTTLDPACPVVHRAPDARGSPAWSVRCTPEERRAYEVGLGLAELLRRNADVIAPALRDLLAAEIERAVNEAVARAVLSLGRPRR